jgi:hypothetical protein
MSRRGMMLIEMMVALLILTAAALVISRLHTSMLKFAVESPARERQTLTWDVTLNRLRADVWSAPRLIDVGAERLVIESDRGEVRWRIDGREIVREGSLLDDVLEQRWPLPTTMSFVRAGDDVELRSDDAEASIPLPHPPTLLAGRRSRP